MKHLFPIFQTHPNLVYLDNAATTHKPQSVISAIVDFYNKSNANIGRSVCCLGDQATQMYEESRQVVQKFVNAKFSEEIIFTRSTTEGINLLAKILCQDLHKDDEIILTELEHHSNLIPWQQIAKLKQLKLKFIPILEDGSLDIKTYKNLFTPKTKIVSITHLSNVLGNITPVREITEIAHQHSCVVIVDGAQAVSKIVVNVQDLDCDFYVFSGHKLYGPTGIGILYGKKALLEKLPQYQTGGKTINEVSWQQSTSADLPHKYEAGTPHISGAIGLAAAIEFVKTHCDLPKESLKNGQILFNHEKYLTDFLIKKMLELPEVKIFGGLDQKLGLISFTVDGIHPLDIATFLAGKQICLRSGHHCAMPLVKKLGQEGVLRISLGMYNTLEDCEFFIKQLKQAIKLLKYV